MSSAQCGAEETASMICIKFTEVLLSFLLLRQVCSQEQEVEFRENGTSIVMGYCFGADYIVVYRSALDGEQLLGNSSNKDLPNTPPVDLQGRIQINNEGNLLGIQIDKLTELDSGIYRRECWQNQTVVKNHTGQLFVCNGETSPEEIVGNNGDGAEIRCRSPFVGLEGTFVRWYQELQPDYRSKLLLDSSVSLEPVRKEMQVFVEARENGALLVLNKTVLQSFPQFYCAVFKGKTCLDFQNIHLPDQSESHEVFSSQGERVVLNCRGDGQLQWETPLGQINSSSPNDNQIYISAGKESGSLSLIIPVISHEHGGIYSCIGPTFELEYALFLCPTTESLEKSAYEGQSVSLECSSGLDMFTRVQWTRHVQAELYEVIGDTFDESVSLPNDLKDRVKLSDSGLLTISNVNRKDERMYRCVVINEFLDKVTEEYDYDNSTNEDYYSEDEQIDGETNGQSNDTDRCFFKQEFILNILTLKREGPGREDEPKNSSNAVVIGLVVVGLLVLAAFIFVLKKKKKPCTTNNNKDNVEANANDPGCTDSLNQNDEDSL